MRISILCIALALVGCGQSVKEVARETSRAAVDESVKQVTADESKAQMAEAMEDPRTERAMVALTDHITEGILKSLGDERAQKQVAALMSQATRAAAREMIASMQSPETRQQMEQLASSLTQTVVTRAGDVITTEMMPAMWSALHRDLSQGGAGRMNGPLHAALGATAQNVAYNAVLGANAGLWSSWEADTGAAANLRQGGWSWLKFGFWSLVLLTAILALAATIAIARGFRARAEVRRLESATLLLATAMHEAHSSTETDEIVSVVRNALERRAPHSGLFNFLHRHPKT